MLKAEHKLSELIVSGTRMYPAAAARFLGRKPDTIMRWIRAGRLTKRVDAAGKIQVLQSEVLALQNNLPQAGRKAADLSLYPQEEGWLTLCEVAQRMADRASYATFYNWAGTGFLKTEGTAPKLTKRLWILRALLAADKLIEGELEELAQLEKTHARTVDKKGAAKRKRKQNVTQD